ncbi:bifunctional DNA-formamidopyrimidine glycosylase/DNA-(apurinic or apyrimidinic site) lyase [Methylomonas sp. AM2-LC]|uniref:bifunctional DNA-formamidopyrimidine glycosylase/DNA-(apurinic or apyrimidinic site) lyase n=1 Tax=Methylomonas sp. AM2-LC TaxID=3153301 RepID=UPI0032666222
MPELPEVETCRAGIAPHIEGKIFKTVIIRQPQLRWPIPADLVTLLPGLTLHNVKRRAKYLILSCSEGSLLLHLGMSGKLRITTLEQPVDKHDHIDFIFTDHTVLRLNDQRRFGAVLWSTDSIDEHPLLAMLGPEPLAEKFDGVYLHSRAGNRSLPIKSFIMDSHIVVGVGNIYASESLFLAGIAPNRPAGQISLLDFQALANAIKSVLQMAILKGGTTLRDFTNPEGKPGYFQQALNVYGRTGQPCLRCTHPISVLKIGQRSSFFCPICQT